MADPSKCPPLTRQSVQEAYTRIKHQIHLTPVLTCSTLNDLASTPQTPEALISTPYEGQTPARPRINFFFKCENYQRIGAFKMRGASHALSRLTDEELEKGVVTSSSGSDPFFSCAPFSDSGFLRPPDPITC
jgi:threonine dehydratase